MSTILAPIIRTPLLQKELSKELEKFWVDVRVRAIYVIDEMQIS
jgi:hypothetical protein